MELATHPWKPPSDRVAITAVTRLKHADLWEAAKKIGGQTALAKHLGVHYTVVNGWVNLHRVPRVDAADQRWMDIEAKLFALTGKLLDDLFPKSLRNSVDFLKSPKKFEQTGLVKAEALEHYATACRARMLPSDPTEHAERGELQDDVRELIKELTYREQEIVKMRYGLTDGYTYTLDEVADALKISRERVRQVEAKAIHKLQRPWNASRLKCHTEFE